MEWGRPRVSLTSSWIWIWIMCDTFGEHWTMCSSLPSTRAHHPFYSFRMMCTQRTKCVWCHRVLVCTFSKSISNSISCWSAFESWASSLFFHSYANIGRFTNPLHRIAARILKINGISPDNGPPSSVARSSDSCIILHICSLFSKIISKCSHEWADQSPVGSCAHLIPLWTPF